MKPFGSILAVLGTGLAVAACMPAPPPTVSKEDLLSSSGFKTISLKTPEQGRGVQEAAGARALEEDLQGQERLGISRPEDLRLPLYRQPDGLQCLHQEGVREDDLHRDQGQRFRQPVQPDGCPSTEMDYDWANDPQAYGLYSDW